MFKGIRRKLTVFSANMAYQRRKLFYPQSAAKQRAMIFKAVTKAGAAGLTRDQIVVATGIPLQSVTWRTRELLRRRGLNETQYPERETRQGGIAKVLFAA